MVGDLHGNIEKLQDVIAQVKNTDSLNGYLLCAGDFGFTWTNKKISELQTFVNKLPIEFEILFIDGNHENFDILNCVNVVNKFDDMVGVLCDRVFYLARGHVYNICEKKIFNIWWCK